MGFEQIFMEARKGDKEAVEKIFRMYRPLLVRRSMVNGFFDEDLYQELSVTLLKCIRKFHV